MANLYNLIPPNLRPPFLLNREKALDVISNIEVNLGTVDINDVERLVTSEEGHAAPQILNSRYLDLVNRFAHKRDGTPWQPTQKVTPDTPCPTSFSWKNGEVPKIFKEFHYEEGAEALQSPLHRWAELVYTCREEDSNMPKDTDFVALYGQEGGQFPDLLITLFNHIADDPSQDSWQWWMQFYLEKDPLDNFISTVHDPVVFATIPPEVQGHLLQMAGVFQDFIDALAIVQLVM